MSSAESPSPLVFIETYGCQMNTYDSSAIVGILTGKGYACTDEVSEADVILLNTCSVRELAEHKIFSRIGELRSLRRHGRIRADIVGVCGCMAERLAGVLAKGTGRADLVAGVDQYDRLPDMLNGLFAEAPAKPPVATGHLDHMHYVAPPEAYPTNNSHLVTIHKGCDYRCTYCIVPETRGPQREKSPAAIVTEIESIVATGGAEVTLLGQNVTAYTSPDMDFAGLLRRVAGIEGLDRIRFLTGHPCDMDEALIRTIAELPTVSPWLHIPAQSGSDRVLRRMKRFYTRGDYLELVSSARRLIPDVTFSGDFIVGFPGETRDDFGQTLELVREVRSGGEEDTAGRVERAPGRDLDRTRRRGDRAYTVGRRGGDGSPTRGCRQGENPQQPQGVAEGLRRRDRRRPRRADHRLRNHDLQWHSDLKRIASAARCVIVWIIKGILYLIILIAMALFFTQNSSESVDLKLLHWQYLDIPLYYVMLGGFLGGLLVSLVVGGIREVKLRNRIRNLGRDLKDRDGEIAELRSLPLRELDEVSEE